MSLLVRNLHRAVNKALDRSVGRYGLASHLTRYIAVLRQTGGASPSELGGFFGERLPTTLAALQILEKKKLVVRERDPQDRRRGVFQLTARGVHIEALAHESVHRMEAVATSRLTEEEILQFRRIVQTILETLEAEAEQGQPDVASD